jgi:hypothetical protein
MTTGVMTVGMAMLARIAVCTVPRLKPHLALVGQVCGDGSERDPAVLDADVPEHRRHGVDDTLGRSAPPPVRVGSSNRMTMRRVRLSAHAVYSSSFPAGCSHSSHQGAHRRSRDRHHLVSALSKHLQHTDVGVPPSATGAQGQRHTSPHRAPPVRSAPPVGCRRQPAQHARIPSVRRKNRPDAWVGQARGHLPKDPVAPRMSPKTRRSGAKKGPITPCPGRRKQTRPSAADFCGPPTRPDAPI